MSKIFVDTNILIYALDGKNKSKRKKARQSLVELRKSHEGVLSTQVLQEFYVAATKKMAVDPIQAKAILQRFEALEVVMIDSYLIKEAIDCSVLHRLSFWDALIIVAAESAKCEVLWTEDLNAGQAIRGVRVHNPFL